MELNCLGREVKPPNSAVATSDLLTNMCVLCSIFNAIAGLANLQATDARGKADVSFILGKAKLVPHPEDDSPLGLSCEPPSRLCNLQDRGITLGLKKHLETLIRTK